MGPEVAIVILAAGASSRMGGRDKLLERVEGEPILRRAARTALATGARVVVVLPPDRPLRGACLDGLAVERVVAEAAREGMAASLRAGLAVAGPGAAGVMVLPADMPGFAADDLRRMIDIFAADPSRILRGATADGRAGHPAVFPADLLPDLMRLDGDAGGRAVIAAQAHRLRLVPLPGERALLDLDTPDDWAAFRARSGGAD